MRFAVLVKQIPAFEELRLGPGGRLVRTGLELEMNAYCRRAVAKSVELAADHGGDVTVVTLGPPSAEDVLREAIAWAADRGVDAVGVLVSDPAFAGSDTLATARALAAVLRREGPFDLVLAGRNAVDADTGQVPPELAELLDLPFLTGVRHLSVDAGGTVEARCEHDDGWVQARTHLPAVCSTAERLCDPCKVPPEGRAAVPAARIRRLGATDLGPGPWGEAASPTRVGGATRVHEVARERRRLDGPIEAQVRAAVDLLAARGALDDTAGDAHGGAGVPVASPRLGDPVLGVVVEPSRERLTRELLGAAAHLARELDGHVVALGTEPGAVALLVAAGADRVVRLDVGEVPVEEDVAAAVGDWAADVAPWALLAPSTAWGREVASRVAARLGAGLTGDAVALEVAEGRLVTWKPAFGGQLVAAVTADSPVQLATVRAGVLPLPTPRRAHDSTVEVRAHAPRGRVEVLARTRDDDLDVLADAQVVIGVGQGVPPDRYGELQPLLDVLGAELGATRKVTDQGWMPRARQIGITGRSIAPRLHVAIATTGKFNHMVGVRGAQTVLAINTDADALVFDAADVGIVGDWQAVVPLLVDELRARTPHLESHRVG